MTTPAWPDALARRFPDLPLTALDALARQGRQRELRRGDALLRPGDAWQHAHWVERGALRLYYVAADGAESNKSFHLDDAFIWPITPELRTQAVSFFVEALEPTVLRSTAMDALEDAVGQLPSWTRLRLATLSHLLEDKMQRERAFLLDDARTRYEALRREHGDWEQRIPLRHLASYLGMRDVSLSRLRARMGLIPGQGAQG